MGASPTPARICPECGTRNSGLSLFCSECGASLTNASSEDTGGSQTTSTFSPVNVPPVQDDPYATQQFQPAPSDQTTTNEPSTALPEWANPAYTNYTSSYQPEEIGRRGMVLGWIAGILILLVIGFLGWSSFLSDGTRDSFIGLFT